MSPTETSSGLKKRFALPGTTQERSPRWSSYSNESILKTFPLLVQYLIERYATKAGRKIRKKSRRILELFQSYGWPGNIRELQNAIERAVILCDGETLSVDETWLKHEHPREAPQLNVPLRGLGRLDVNQEREMIEAALLASQGRISGPSGAAAKFGIPRQTLESKIASLGINKYRFKSA
jgi:DNA-binding NtrC family response regulator